MKKRYFSKTLFALSLITLTVTGCSSGGDEPDNGSSGSNNSPMGQVPENTDSGKNNSPTPDNVNNNGGSQENPTWNLIFEDNFEGPDSIPDTSKWSLAKKGDNTWSRYMSESYAQAYQKDGYLYLFGMQDKAEYLCGGIETIDKFSFTYGQVKCRARFLRQPQGNHTGIWMMPEPPAEQWPKSGEIDIMEHLDDQSKVYETVHNWWADDMGHADDPLAHTSFDIDNEEFNTYGIVWDKDSITFTVNGETVFSYANQELEGENGFYQWPYSKPFYLILSQSLGGKGTWEGVIDNSELPAIFQIDWIKVWQKGEN